MLVRRNFLCHGHAGTNPAEVGPSMNSVRGTNPRGAAAEKIWSKSDDTLHTVRARDARPVERSAGSASCTDVSRLRESVPARLAGRTDRRRCIRPDESGGVGSCRASNGSIRRFR